MVLGGLKTWVWVISIRWALKEGQGFARQVENNPGQSLAQKMSLLKSLNGAKIWPGVKSVCFWTPTPGPWRRIWNSLYVRTPTFLALVGVGILALSIQPRDWVIAHSVAVGLSIWMSIYSLFLLVEGIIYTGSWMLHTRNAPSRSPRTCTRPALTSSCPKRWRRRRRRRRWTGCCIMLISARPAATPSGRPKPWPGRA